jgi:hypothetical protein
VVGSCEHGNETLEYYKRRGIFYYLSDCQFLNDQSDQFLAQSNIPPVDDILIFGPQLIRTISRYTPFLFEIFQRL